MACALAGAGPAGVRAAGGGSAGETAGPGLRQAAKHCCRTSHLPATGKTKHEENHSRFSLLVYCPSKREFSSRIMELRSQVVYVEKYRPQAFREAWESMVSSSLDPSGILCL